LVLLGHPRIFHASLDQGRKSFSDGSIRDECDRDLATISWVHFNRKLLERFSVASQQQLSGFSHFSFADAASNLQHNLYRFPEAQQVQAPLPLPVMRREVRTSEESWGITSTLPDCFTGHLRIRPQQFAFALASDSLESGKSI
jgi:hypothetical protein